MAYVHGRHPQATAGTAENEIARRASVMIHTLLLVLSGLVVGATLLPLLRSPAWWIRVFDFPRLQLASLGGAVIIGLVWTAPGGPGVWSTVAAVAVGLCVLFHMFRIWPYTPLAPRQVGSARAGRRNSGSDEKAAIKLLISNVLMKNRDAARLLEHLRAESPDLVLLLEADDRWRDRIARDVAGYGHRVEQPQDNTYGMLLYSRLPLVESRVEFLIDDRVPSIWTKVLLPNGVAVKLVCLHPRPPRPVKLQGTEERDAELLAVGLRLGAVTSPTVVAGDLNDVAWSRTTRKFGRISGLLDPRRGRGLFSTFHADHAWLRYPLDHVFSSGHFRLRGLRRLSHVGSDHFPVLVDLEYDTDGPAPRRLSRSRAGGRTA